MVFILILEQTIPEVILLSSKLDEVIVDILNNAIKDWCKHIEEDATEESPVHTPPLVQYLPSTLFNHPIAESVLNQLHIFQGPDLEVRDVSLMEDQTLSIHSMIDFHDQAAVRASGALVGYAQKNNLVGTELNAIHSFDLNEYLLVDRNSLSSLEVFKVEEHPSVIRGRGRQKQGFSLFSLLDRSRCALGRQALRGWILKVRYNTT